MPNLASVLKEEIIRLARKEMKKELDGLRKTSSSYRSEIAALKRRILVLEKEMGRPARKGAKLAVAVGPDVDSSKVRFSAKGLVAMRKKLGLSAAGMGMLLGVSAQTIYHWEAGKTRPRQQHSSAPSHAQATGARSQQSASQTRTETVPFPTRPVGIRPSR